MIFLFQLYRGFTYYFDGKFNGKLGMTPETVGLLIIVFFFIMILNHFIISFIDKLLFVGKGDDKSELDEFFDLDEDLADETGDDHGDLVDGDSCDHGQDGYPSPIINGKVKTQ